MHFWGEDFPLKRGGLLWGDILDHKGWPRVSKLGVAGHTGVQPVIKVGFAIPGMGSPPSPTCKGGSSITHLSPPALGCCGAQARRSLSPLIKVDAKPAAAVGSTFPPGSWHSPASCLEEKSCFGWAG